MAQLKFRRKLGEAWVFDLTAKDRTDQRQTIAGVGDLAATLTKLDGTVLWTGDTAGCQIVETGAATYGDFKYTRTDLTGVTLGTYHLDFKCTLFGLATKFPEDGYVIVEVI